jgi:hypothetical protein
MAPGKALKGTEKRRKSGKWRGEKKKRENDVKWKNA